MEPVLGVSSLTELYARTRDNDAKLNDIVYRGIRDMVHERNAAWSGCQVILTEYIFADITKLIAAFAYGEEQTIPDIAAFNLAHNIFNIIIGDIDIDWGSWGRSEISRYVEYECVYHITVSKIRNGAMNNESSTYGWINMFSAIEFILTGFSINVFSSLTSVIFRHREIQQADINFESEESALVLRTMRLFRERFLIAE